MISKITHHKTIDAPTGVKHDVIVVYPTDHNAFADQVSFVVTQGEDGWVFEQGSDDLTQALLDDGYAG